MLWGQFCREKATRLSGCEASRERGCWPVEASELQNELTPEGKKDGTLG